MGIENVLALRGDPPQGEERFVQTEGGLAYASELAALVRDSYDFCIVGAAYPEVHSECSDLQTDLRNLKAKVDAGVRVLITQLFFDNAHYFRLRRGSARRGHRRADRARDHADPSRPTRSSG